MDEHDARLFDGDDDSSLSPEIATIASRYPESFLNHLRAAWEKHGSRAAQIPSVLTSLKATLVLCEDGVKRPLSTTYLPTRRLRTVVEKFILPDDNFPFLQFQKFWRLEENADSWAFLSLHLGVGDAEELDLYLDILKTIRGERYFWDWTKKYPNRFISIYLHIETTYGGHDSNREMIREVFEEHKLVLSPKDHWERPSNCALTAVNASSWHSALLKTGLLPLNPAWNNTDEELVTILQFFRATLGIVESPRYYEFTDLLYASKSKSFTDEVFRWDDVKRCYEIINNSLEFLSHGDKAQLKSAFVDSSYIAIRSDGTLRWYKQTDCIWCPSLQSCLPGYVDLSEEYKDLEDFFVSFLGVKNPWASFEALLQHEPTNASIDSVKEMLLTLSTVVPGKGKTLDPAPLLSKKILPVRGKDNEIQFCTADADFYIIDRPDLDVFRKMIPVLDFSLSDVAHLMPLLKWAALECHYLSRNVKVSSFLQDSYPSLLDGCITREKACGLLRIASHYRSPRTVTLKQRQSLLRQLEGTRFIETAGIFREVKLILADGSEVIRKLPGQLHIVERNVGLRIYVPRDKTSQELSAVLLPRLLVQWMVTDPENDMMPVIDEVSVSLVKSISNVRDELIQRVLTEEGVIPFESLGTFALTNPKPSKRIPIRLPKPVAAEIEVCPDAAVVKLEAFSVPGLAKTETPSPYSSSTNRSTLQPVSIRSKVPDNHPALSETSKMKPPVEQETPTSSKLPETTFTFQAGQPFDPQVNFVFFSPATEARMNPWAGK
ncbi:hypothetical protein HG530_006564 [Fusarium avenaceum]|nr:hypothetical protein HG530_006564 [Fusarium avenaceum]